MFLSSVDFLIHKYNLVTGVNYLKVTYGFVERSFIELFALLKSIIIKSSFVCLSNMYLLLSVSIIKPFLLSLTSFILYLQPLFILRFILSNLSFWCSHIY